MWHQTPSDGMDELLETPCWHSQGATWHWNPKCVRGNEHFTLRTILYGEVGRRGTGTWFACHRCALLPVLEQLVAQERADGIELAPVVLATLPKPGDVEDYRHRAWARTRATLEEWVARDDRVRVVESGAERYAVACELGPWSIYHASRPWWCLYGEPGQIISIDAFRVALGLARERIGDSRSADRELHELVELGRLVTV